MRQLVTRSRAWLADALTRAARSLEPARIEAPNALTQAATLQAHQLLDDAFHEKLAHVVEDTERSAHDIVHRVAGLHEAASTIVGYLDRSDLQTGSIGQEIAESVARLVEIRDFLEALPERMERSLRTVGVLVDEISNISGMVESVQGLSMQSHLLAVNAAIEASRAGVAGRAFRIIADEMRALAANSGECATRISAGLTRAQAAVDGGIRDSMRESPQQMAQVADAREAIERLQHSFEDMTQYYKTRFAVVTRHNQQLSADIAEVLGQTQYQDVVRQSIVRIQDAMRRRAQAMAAPQEGEIASPGAAITKNLQEVLEDFVAEESNHVHSARLEDTADNEGALRIELF